jgi:hypothetical protein
MADKTPSPATPDDKVVSLLKRDQRAQKNSIKLIAHARQHHFHKAGPGIGADEMRTQDYWSNVCHLLTRHDIITAITDDESQEFELVVERVVQGGAQVSVRKVYARETVVHAGRIVDGIGNFYTEWRAGKGWCIVRKSDGHPILTGHTLEENAIAQWRREQPKMVVR